LGSLDSFERAAIRRSKSLDSRRSETDRPTTPKTINPSPTNADRTTTPTTTSTITAITPIPWAASPAWPGLFMPLILAGGATNGCYWPSIASSFLLAPLIPFFTSLMCGAPWRAIAQVTQGLSDLPSAASGLLCVVEGQESQEVRRSGRGARGEGIDV